MAQVAKAKVFRNGRSQAVRIPAQFRFNTNQVYIQRDETTGVVSLSEEPPRTSMADLFARINAEGPFDDFVIERHTEPPDEREPW